MDVLNEFLLSLVLIVQGLLSCQVVLSLDWREHTYIYIYIYIFFLYVYKERERVILDVCQSNVAP